VFKRLGSSPRVVDLVNYCFPFKWPDHHQPVIIMDDFQVSGADSRAIRKEIGERLRGSLLANYDLSPRLLTLMKQMVAADGERSVAVISG
jgi:hypothetical protein